MQLALHRLLFVVSSAVSSVAAGASSCRRLQRVTVTVDGAVPSITKTWSHKDQVDVFNLVFLPIFQQ